MKRTETDYLGVRTREGASPGDRERVTGEEEEAESPEAGMWRRLQNTLHEERRATCVTGRPEVT